MSTPIECPNIMKIIRGTTPTIIINIKDEIDLSQVVKAWIYISQRGKVRVDKTTESIEIIPQEMKILTTLSQEETLNLKQGDANFQVRLLFEDGTALASKASDIQIFEVYKEGVIEDE